MPLEAINRHQIVRLNKEPEISYGVLTVPARGRVPYSQSADDDKPQEASW